MRSGDRSGVQSIATHIGHAASAWHWSNGGECLSTAVFSILYVPDHFEPNLQSSQTRTARAETRTLTLSTQRATRTPHTDTFSLASHQKQGGSDSLGLRLCHMQTEYGHGLAHMGMKMWVWTRGVESHVGFWVTLMGLSGMGSAHTPRMLGRHLRKISAGHAGLVHAGLRIVHVVYARGAHAMARLVHTRASQRMVHAGG